MNSEEFLAQYKSGIRIFQEISLENLIFDKETLTELELIDCEISNCFFQDVDLSRSKFNQVEIFKSSFSGSKMIDFFFQGTMHWCKLDGINATGLILDDFSINDSDLSGSIFNKSKIKLGGFNRVNLEESFFLNSLFEVTGDDDGVRFTESNLLKATFNGSKLDNVNFINCLLGRWAGVTDFKKCSLRGTEFSISLDGLIDNDDPFYKAFGGIGNTISLRLIQKKQ